MLYIFVGSNKDYSIHAFMLQTIGIKLVMSICGCLCPRLEGVSRSQKGHNLLIRQFFCFSFHARYTVSIKERVTPLTGTTVSSESILKVQVDRTVQIPLAERVTKSQAVFKHHCNVVSHSKH